MKARLELGFRAGGGRTRLQVGAQEPPWKVIRAFQQENGTALVHLHNVSGGVLAGDELALDIRVGSGARAQVTSTGATRLYRHRPDTRDSEQRISIAVGAGGILEYLPDALIPFAGSRHRQQTEVVLTEGATFLAWDVVAPGRLAMGERFGFHSLRLATRIETAGRLVLLEDFHLQPHTRPLDSAARLGAYTHMATFVAIQAGRATADLLELERRLAGIAAQHTRDGCTIWGTSALVSDGVIVKGLSTTAHHIPATLAGFWSAARRFLTGEEAVPPRKIK